MQEESFEDLKNELVVAAEEQAPEEKPEEPKKSTKQFLIDKILDFAADGIEVPSHAKLKRMSKKALSELLAELIEKKMHKKVCESVNAPIGSDNKTILLSSLRMVHDLVANVTEQGCNMLLNPRGYQLENFSENLKNPEISECVDQCLLEITEQHSEILEYIESPFSRLSICWFTCAAQNIKPYSQRNNATILEPPKLRRQTALGAGPHRRTQNRKEFYASPPSKPVQKVV